MSLQADDTVETPSGKGAKDENFPVGSFLLPARLRPAVAAYYAFARGTDDIADNPQLTPDEKVARLERMRAALEDGVDDPSCAVAIRLRGVMDRYEIPYRHGADLLSAFKQDAVKGRYADWDELVDYCMRSAAPVGRFLVALHGETDARAYLASDALCVALQILNHLQDCGDDFSSMDRVYLPQDWLGEEGATTAALGDDGASAGLRRVLDQCLDGCDRLIADARALPVRLRDRRFAMEASTIVRLAARLAARLRRGDPLATRVALSKADFAWAGAQGVWEGLFGARPRATSTERAAA